MIDAQLKSIPDSILQYYKKIEDEYKKNLQVYQSLFYQNPESVFSLDLDGAITSANKVMAAKCECEEAELLSVNFSNFIHPDFKTISKHYFDEAKNGNSLRFEIKIITAKKNILHVAIKNMPIYVDGTIVGIFCIATDITERILADTEKKTAIANLEKANVEKNNILESIAEGFFAIDNNWNFLYCNKIVESILGVENQNITGRNLWELFELSHAANILIHFKKAIQERVKVYFEVYYKPLNIWLNITAYPNENGLSSIIKVVNEEKRLEQLFQLEKSALELNADINTSSETIVKVLADGLQKIHPEMLCTLLHVKQGALYNWYAPNIPEEYLKLINGFPIGMNQGSCGTSAFTKETVIVEDIEHSSIWQEYKDIAASFGFKACWSFPLLDKEKNVFGTFGIYYRTVKKPSEAEINSTERIKNLLTTIIINKKAEEEILLSKERYDIVAKATNDAIWDCDVATRTVLWNNAISTMFGYDIDEEVENTMDWALNHIHSDDRNGAVKKIFLQLKKHKNTFSHELRFLCADGNYKYVQNRMFIIKDAASGLPVRVIGALQDVSEQKSTELKLRELNEALELRAEQLATSNTELERFAYIASHDLQEPLRTITSFLQLFKRKYAGQVDETGDNYINFAVEGADRMKQLILDMLEYSRVNTTLNLNEEIDIRQVINEVLFNFSGKIKLSDAIIELGDFMPRINAVKTQMMQLFQNLISNAIKYQQAGNPPHITITASENEKDWRFTVADNGIGIDEKFYDKIFVIFQRLHSKTQYAGTGIGLAICKKIVEKHNGRIWVSSELKKGSTFHFTIPKKIIK